MPRNERFSLPIPRILHDRSLRLFSVRIADLFRNYLVSYITISLFSVPIAEAFNKADDPLLTTIASGGMRIYFINLFFAGVNIIASAFLCSCDKPKLAFVISVLRGFILIIPAAWILSSLFGLTGIWLTVPVTEAIVCLFSFLFLFRGTHTQIVQST